MLSDTNCSWFMFSSTGGIANSYMASLGIYKKVDSGNLDKIVYYNEKSALYLFRLKSQDVSWKVNFVDCLQQIVRTIYDYNIDLTI